MAPKKLTEVPYSVLHDLCRILDSCNDDSKNWRALASIIGNYSNIDIAMFEKEFQKLEGSPCRSIINDWAMLGSNIDELFTLIYKIGNFEAFELLKSSKYVSKSLAKSLTLTANPQPSIHISRNPYDSRSIVNCTSVVNDVAPCSTNQISLSIINERKDQVTDAILEDLKSKDLIEFSYNEVSAATQNFDDRLVRYGGPKIGVGSFGTVYKGALKNTTFAIKRLTLHRDLQSRSVGLRQFAIEVIALSKYRHPNLLELAGYSLDPKAPCLVYYYMDKGSLASVLSAEEAHSLTWNMRLNITGDVAKGLVYLHTALDKPLIHRDLKSANVLLTTGYQAKIGDFGLARIGSAHMDNIVKTNRLQGTMGYISPEAALGEISVKIDIYSLGVLYLELLLNLPAFDRNRGFENQTLVSLAENMMSSHSKSFGLAIGSRGTPWPREIAIDFINLCQICFLEQNNRPTANEVLDKVESLKSKYANKTSFDSWIEPSNMALRSREQLRKTKRTIAILTENREHNVLVRDKMSIINGEVISSSLRSLGDIEFHFVTLHDAIIIITNPISTFVKCVNDTINKFNPDLMLNVGTCNGVRGRTSLCDIVVCSEVMSDVTAYPLSKVLVEPLTHLLKGQQDGLMLWQLPGTMPLPPAYSSSQMLLWVSKILMELNKPYSEWLKQLDYNNSEGFLSNMKRMCAKYPDLGTVKMGLFINMENGMITGPDVNLKVAVNKYYNDIDMKKRKHRPRLHVGSFNPDTLPYELGMAFERYQLCQDKVLASDSNSLYLYSTCTKTQVLIFK